MTIEVTTANISAHPVVIYQLLQVKHFETRTASARISVSFLAMLEQQFPITDSKAIELRYPSRFAEQLNVHVNHLNRALKETLNKTTTEIISLRVLHESKLLLVKTDWDIAEIAYALGFSEPTHFNNFFKKRMHVSPSNFRHSQTMQSG
jgi:AraC-like DNA-binding protein